MRINSLMNNKIQNTGHIQQSQSFKGVEKAAQAIVNEINVKPPKKDGFIEEKLNKYLHLDKHIARGAAKLSQTKASQSLVEWTRKRDHGAARWCDIESVAVTFFYMWNTWKSDKVDEERKVPSMIQNAAVTIASSTAAALVDGALDPLIDKIGLKYMELEKNNPDLIKEIGGRSAKDFYDAIKKLKSNTAFTAVVRFIVPVLMVPVVGKIVAKLNEKKEEQEEANKAAQNAQIIQAPQPQPVQANASSYDDDDHDDNDDHDDDDNKIIDAAENKFKALFA